MNIIEQRVAKDAVRWPSASELFVTKSLPWWIWESTVIRGNAPSSVYPALMPPEGLAGFNWTSSVIAVHTSSEMIEQRVPWRYTLLLMTIGTIVGAWIWQKLIRKTPSPWKKAVLIAEPNTLAPDAPRKTLKVKTLGVLDEVCPRKCLPCHQPGRSSIHVLRSQPCLAADDLTLAQTTNVVDVSTKTQTTGKKMVNKLALSEVVFTIDIPPSSPEQVDDNAIIQLSELLQRW
ncbi:hypothetical protein BU25DRAFT_119497 [Macroventuria anomochaeta]|uniref:Uncharacterized protein n=1 Tax=Macroventuria anomochaeta TaxID=301207 RepID=A0ACB6RTU2_9PLEO|nr:uncharacterized protein BU25DRAFT_119497 [Macroventuria anomochaeta]KAF2625336.1 hypothetical protein BU25DRAFT_119497 [Macroventuria anomochaeta]